MRGEFKKTLLYICLEIEGTSLQQKPAFFFLGVLLDKLNFMTTQVNHQNTLEYFDLFAAVLRLYFEQPSDAKKLFDERELLSQVLR
jgi:hypothetical protein